MMRRHEHHDLLMSEMCAEHVACTGPGTSVNQARHESDTISTTFGMERAGRPPARIARLFRYQLQSRFVGHVRLLALAEIALALSINGWFVLVAELMPFVKDRISNRSPDTEEPQLFDLRLRVTMCGEVLRAVAFFKEADPRRVDDRVADLNPCVTDDKSKQTSVADH
jgi:hypothetical protein